MKNAERLVEMIKEELNMRCDVIKESNVFMKHIQNKECLDLMQMQVFTMIGIRDFIVGAALPKLREENDKDI